MPRDTSAGSQEEGEIVKARREFVRVTDVH